MYKPLERQAIKNRILEERLQILPDLMRETDLEAWILIADEYNEGPCFKTFLPSTYHQARRKMIFLFLKRDQTFKKYVLALPDFEIDAFYEPKLLRPPNFDYRTFYTTFHPEYDLDEIAATPEEDQFTCLRRLLMEFNPRNIAINVSEHSRFADGLSKANYDKLINSLPNILIDRLCSAEALVTRWLETRTETEIKVMTDIAVITKTIIGDAFQAIQPEVTKAGDVRNHLMTEAEVQGMTCWFNPTLWIKRPGMSHIDDDNCIILPGDLLHVDFGLSFMNLCSDIQEMAFVSGNPLLEAAYQRMHQETKNFQDLVMATFQGGKTGNTILREALDLAHKQGIKGPRLYSHPIGLHGHGAGTTIGTFGNQTFVEGSGQHPVHNSTAYALELCVQQPVPELDNQIILYGLECEILFKDQKVHFLSSRQEKLHIL